MAAIVGQARRGRSEPRGPPRFRGGELPLAGGTTGRLHEVRSVHRAEPSGGVAKVRADPDDACSLIDSILRDCADGGKRHTLKEYAVLHEEHLELEGTTSLLLVSPLQFLPPFRGWCGATPVWWDAYNKVKHDRIRNYAAATYSCAVSAMAGLHQLLARSWQFLGQLTLAGWFNETSAEFGELGASRAAGSGPLTCRFRHGFSLVLSEATSSTGAPNLRRSPTGISRNG